MAAEAISFLLALSANIDNSDNVTRHVLFNTVDIKSYFSAKKKRKEQIRRKGGAVSIPVGFQVFTVDLRHKLSRISLQQTSLAFWRKPQKRESCSNLMSISPFCIQCFTYYLYSYDTVGRIVEENVSKLRKNLSNFVFWDISLVLVNYHCLSLWKHAFSRLDSEHMMTHKAIKTKNQMSTLWKIVHTSMQKAVSACVQLII